MMRSRNHKEDWTEVLQERLRDASLPLEDGWAAGGSMAPGARPDRNAPWAWALAGVAAVALAAVLLLRPARPDAPEPVRLVQAPDSSSAVPGLAAVLPDQTAVVPDVSATIPGSTSVIPGLTRNQIPDQVREDKKEVLDDDKQALEANQEVLDDKQEVLETTKKAREVVAVPPPGLEEQTREEFQEEPAARRSRRGAVSLRVQAGVGGTSSAFAPGAMASPQIVQGDGQWILLGNVVSEGKQTSSDMPTFNALEGGDIWRYVPNSAEAQPVMLPVRQAPVFPVSFGVSAGLPLSRSWVLTAGLDYMQRGGYRLFNEMPQSLTLHYLGIPLDIHFYFNPESRWRFYLGAGLHAGKCIAVSGGDPLPEPVLFSGSLMAGTDFRIVPGVRLYLAPAVSGFFNRSTYVNSWDDKPVFQLRAGLSFDLK